MNPIPVERELPPIDVPVWMYLPNIRQWIIGCRSDDGEGWLWCRCHDDFWFDGGEWKTSTTDADDDDPSHWMPLPLDAASPSTSALSATVAAMQTAIASRLAAKGPMYEPDAEWTALRACAVALDEAARLLTAYANVRGSAAAQYPARGVCNGGSNARD